MKLIDLIEVLEDNEIIELKISDEEDYAKPFDKVEGLYRVLDFKNEFNKRLRDFRGISDYILESEIKSIVLKKQKDWRPDRLLIMLSMGEIKIEYSFKESNINTENPAVGVDYVWKIRNGKVLYKRCF